MSSNSSVSKTKRREKLLPNERTTEEVPEKNKNLFRVRRGMTEEQRHATEKCLFIAAENAHIIEIPFPAHEGMFNKGATTVGDQSAVWKVSRSEGSDPSVSVRVMVHSRSPRDPRSVVLVSPKTGKVQCDKGCANWATYCYGCGNSLKAEGTNPHPPDDFVLTTRLHRQYYKDGRQHTSPDISYVYCHVSPDCIRVPFRSFQPNSCRIPSTIRFTTLNISK